VPSKKLTSSIVAAASAAAANTVSNPLIKPDMDIAPFALSAAMTNHAALLLSNEEGIDLPDFEYFLRAAPLAASAQSNRKRNFEKANVEVMYSVNLKKD